MQSGISPFCMRAKRDVQKGLSLLSGAGGFSPCPACAKGTVPTARLATLACSRDSPRLHRAGKVPVCTSQETVPTCPLHHLHLYVYFQGFIYRSPVYMLCIGGATLGLC